MQITVLVATLTVENKPVPLTKGIVLQIPNAEGEFVANERFAPDGGDCEVLGEVEIDFGKKEASRSWLLISTPKGVRRLDSYHKAALNNIRTKAGLSRIEKIILLK